MVTTFFNYKPSRIILLAIYLLLIRLGFFFAPPTEIVITQSTLPLFDTIFTFFSEHLALSYTLNTILIFAQALLINQFSNIHKLLKQLSYVPAMIYILLASINPFLLQVTPELFSYSLIVLSTLLILQTYNQKIADLTIYNASFLIGLALFFSFSALPFYLINVITLFLVRPIKWREYVISLFGLLTPFTLLLSYHYLTDQLSLLSISFSYFSKNEISLSSIFMVKYGFIILLFIGGSFIFFSKRFKYIIHRRNIFNLLYLSIPLGVFSILFTNIVDERLFIYLVFPFTIILSYLFTQIRRMIVLEMVHVSILIFIFVTQYKLIFIK